MSITQPYPINVYMAKSKLYIAVGLGFALMSSILANESCNKQNQFIE